MAEELVSNENLSQQLLMELCKSAYLTVEPMDEHNFLVREEPLRVNVSIDEHRKRFIRFWAAFRINKQRAHAQRIEYINRVNEQLIFVRAEISEAGGEGAFVFDYFLWVEGGVTKRNIISAFKEFVAVVRDAYSLDTEGVIG